MENKKIIHKVATFPIKESLLHNHKKSGIHFTSTGKTGHGDLYNNQPIQLVVLSAEKIDGGTHALLDGEIVYVQETNEGYASIGSGRACPVNQLIRISAVYPASKFNDLSVLTDGFISEWVKTPVEEIYIDCGYLYNGEAVGIKDISHLTDPRDISMYELYFIKDSDGNLICSIDYDCAAYGTLPSMNQEVQSIAKQHDDAVRERSMKWWTTLDKARKSIIQERHHPTKERKDITKDEIDEMWSAETQMMSNPKHCEKDENDVCVCQTCYSATEKICGYDSRQKS